MAPHSSTLAWKIPWTEEPGRLQSMGSLRVGHDWASSLSLSCIGEGNGNPLQCSCLENPRDGGSWWAAICGVAQSRTRLKRFSNSSSMETLSHSAEGLMLKLKFQYFDHLMRKADSFEKTLMLGKIEGRRRREWQRMRWLDGQLNGHEFEQALGVSDGQGIMACCSPWDCKESDMTEWLNWMILD